MPINISPTQLYKQIQTSFEVMEPHVQQRQRAMEEFLGSEYGSAEKKKKKRPVNLIAYTVRSLLPLLAFKNPEHDVVPLNSALQGEAASLKLVLDQLAQDMRLVNTSRLCLLDAFVSPFSVAKVGIRAGGDTVKIQGRQYDMGQPYIQHIRFSDYFCDSNAKSADELMWEGHKYRVPKQIAIESGIFNPSMIEKVPSLRFQAPGVGEDGGRYVDNSAVGDEKRGEMIEMIELMDVAFYDEDTTIIATLAAVEGYQQQFLRVEEYQGPEMGPYERLEFMPIPGSSIGLAPAAAIMEQHESLVKIADKVVDQIMRAKRIPVGSRSAEDDLKAIGNAVDGEMTTVDDVGSVKDLDFGGVSPQALEGFQLLAGMGQQAAGAPDMLAGAGDDSDTATEYQGRMGQAGARVQDMGEVFQGWHDRLAKHMAFYITTDPLIQKGTTARLPGGEYLNVRYDAATRKGTYPDFMFKIVHRSMGALDPSVQSKRVVEGIQVLMGAAQASMATGGLVDVASVARVISRNPGSEGLEEVIRDPIVQQAIQARMQAAPQGQPGQVVGSTPQQGKRPNYSLNAVNQPQNTTAVGASAGAREFAQEGVA